MRDINVRKVSKAEDRSLPVFAELERLSQEIERRARELFESRAYGEGHALDDWLQAEHEICWPAAELVEQDGQFMLSVALPGYEPSEIELTVTPREIIVHAGKKVEKGEAGQECRGHVHWSEFRSKDVYRRFGLPATIDADRAKATFRHGMLRVTAPEAKSMVEQIQVDAAA